MPECQLELPGERRGLPRDHDLFHPQPAEHRSSPVVVDPRQPRDRAQPEGEPDDCRVLQQRLLLDGQRVEPGRDEPLDRTGDLDVLDREGLFPALRLCRPQHPPVDEHADDLLDVERVPFAPLRDERPDLGREALGEEVVDHRLALLRGERVEEDRRVVPVAAAPLGSVFQELRPGQGQDEDRPLAPVGQVVHEVEQPLVGPVDVLQHEHQRVSGSHPLEEPPPSVEQLLAGEVPLGGSADQGSDVLRHLEVAEQLPHRVVGLGAGDLRRVVLEDLALGLHRFGERRVRHVAVGEAPALAPVDELGEPLDIFQELPRQARLADAGVAEDRDEPGPALLFHPVERLLEDGELLVAADQPGLEAERRALAPSAGLDPERLPRGNGLCLALQLERLELAVVDDILGGGVRARADDHATGFRGGLQPAGGVDRVAGEHAVAGTGGALEVDEHLAGLHPDPHLERRPALGGEAPVELGEHRLQLERRPHGALGVVLVRLRHAEHRQHGIAHELLEEPAVAFDLARQPVERRPDERLDDLGVLALGEFGGADQVGEQRGRELALPTGRARAGRLERRPARRAEPRPLGVLESAGGASDRHGPDSTEPIPPGRFTQRG